MTTNQPFEIEVWDANIALNLTLKDGATLTVEEIDKGVAYLNLTSGTTSPLSDPLIVGVGISAVYGKAKLPIPQ